MEGYRSGHNGTDSKSAGPGKTGTRVRIPPLPFAFFKIRKIKDIWKMSQDTLLEKFLKK